MEAIRLEPSRKREAAEVAKRAFFNYPLFTFYFPEPRRRERYLGWYLGNVISCALRYGDVFTTPGLAGVALTLPPGHTQVSLWEYIRNGFTLAPVRLGLRNFQRSMTSERFAATVHKSLMRGRAHVYLWSLAVDPNRQAAGVGSALVHAVLARADAMRLPVYLETHAERNVQYYQRHGFELIHHARVPAHDLPVWFMLREAH